MRITLRFSISKNIKNALVANDCSGLTGHSILSLNSIRANVTKTTPSATPSTTDPPRLFQPYINIQTRVETPILTLHKLNNTRLDTQTLIKSTILATSTPICSQTTTPYIQLQLYYLLIHPFSIFDVFNRFDPSRGFC